MRVLVWAEVFWPRIGGIEVLTAQLLRALRDRGHEFLVLTQATDWRLPGDDNYHGIAVHRLPFWEALASRDLEQFSRIRTQVAQLKHRFAPDLVHLHGLGFSAVFHHWTAAVCRVPSVLTIHSMCDDDDLEYDTLRGRSVRSADWVTAVSAAVLAGLHRRLPALRARSSVIHNAVESVSAPIAPLPVDQPRLLCLGRIVPEKGFDLALSALAILRPRFPQLRMMIVGDGTGRQELERLAAALKVRDIVDFMGWVAPDHVPAIINAATVVMIPSRREGLPLVALQAAWLGRPVVATRVGGVPEIVVSGTTGLLVETEDSSGLALALARLLQSPNLVVHMGEAARCRVEATFGWQHCVDAYHVLYERLIKGGVHAGVG